MNDIYGDFVMCFARGKDDEPTECAVKISEIKKIQHFNKKVCLIYLYKDDPYLCHSSMAELLEQIYGKKQK